jgi:hypothetical protein
MLLSRPLAKSHISFQMKKFAHVLAKQKQSKIIKKGSFSSLFLSKMKEKLNRPI